MSNPVMDAGFGGILVVIFLACLLSGTVITQAYTYFTLYPSDRTALKLYVASILIIDMAATVFAILWQYHILIVNWADASSLFVSSWLLALNPLFCGIMGLLVHSFFAWRIRLLSGSRLWPLAVLVFALPAFAGAVGTCAWASHITTVDSKQRFKAFGIVWLVSGVLTDGVITGSLSYHLRKRKSDFQQTNHVLDRLVRLTVQNGLLTAVVASIDLILFLTPGAPARTVSFMMPKLYAITVISSLNSRQSEQERDRTMTHLESGHGIRTRTGNVPGYRGSVQRNSALPRQQISIKVQTERSQIADTWMDGIATTSPWEKATLQVPS